MAFNIAGLKRITHMGAIGTGAGSVRSIWGYITNDDAATVGTANYFNGAVSEMLKGDLIIASLDNDGTPKPAVYVVLTNNGTNVTISGVIVTT